MQLSPHFSLNELTKSQTALRRHIANQPEAVEIRNLQRLADQILEPVRAHFGRPFSPTSGFRSQALNQAIGSGRASQHIAGEAADFQVPGVANLVLACWIRDNLEFDQLIIEFFDEDDPTGGWVHCSLKEYANRRSVLTISRVGVSRGLPSLPPSPPLAQTAPSMSGGV